MAELQAEFDKLDVNGKDKPKQIRFLRSQQELKDKSEDILESIVTSTNAINDQEDLDPFEMLEPVNILERLPKDFFDKIVVYQKKTKFRLISSFYFKRNRNNGKIERKLSMNFFRFSRKIQSQHRTRTIQNC